MRRLLAALACAAAASSARAQVKNAQEGEAMLGLSGQNDTQSVKGVSLSPVGLNIGFIVQPIFSKRRLALVEQVSIFPVSKYERQTDLFGNPFPGHTQPLIMSATWVRLATDEPEVYGKFVYFAGVGASVAAITPRTGTKATGLIAIGARRWFSRQVGVEVSLQCGVQQVGRTQCTLPITSLWPFG